MSNILLFILSILMWWWKKNWTVKMEAALLTNSVAIILAHNHPSGNLKPSRQDMEITKQVKEAARLMRITVLDHLILTDTGYYSFADEGEL